MPLGQLPPGARGYLIGEQSAQRNQDRELQQLQGVLSMQGALAQQRQLSQLNPLQIELLKAQIGETQAQAAERARPRYQPLSQFGTIDPSGKIIPPIASQNPFAGVHNVPGGYLKSGPNNTFEFTRTQIEPPAPTQAITRGQVVDPKNPGRLLEVDLRLYKGGTLGDIGVFGVAGREPTAAKRDERAAEGRDLLKTELDNLRTHYDVLNESKAIPSSERGVASNAAAWVQSSTIGQMGGRIIGSKEQDARNQIQSSRLRLMNAIKNATGMSAQMLNSNVELQTWLNSLTNPQNTYETNIGILDAIENTFLKGAKPEDGKKTIKTPKDIMNEADRILGGG